ncbi:MAG: thiosulfate oxidation carrier complex protein SoxZ [Arenicellales bacterium]
MSTKMKIKKSADGGYEVMVLAKHPMETGLRKDSKTGEKIPAHFIKTMEFSLNGTAVAQADLGTGVSTNPLISVHLADAKPGDTVGVNWMDNKGESDSAEAAVK